MQRGQELEDEAQGATASQDRTRIYFPFRASFMHAALLSSAPFLSLCLQMCIKSMRSQAIASQMICLKFCMVCPLFSVISIIHHLSQARPIFAFNPSPFFSDTSNQQQKARTSYFSQNFLLLSSFCPCLKSHTEPQLAKAAIAVKRT